MRGGYCLLFVHGVSPDAPTRGSAGNARSGGDWDDASCSAWLRWDLSVLRGYRARYLPGTAGTGVHPGDISQRLRHRMHYGRRHGSPAQSRRQDSAGELQIVIVAKKFFHLTRQLWRGSFN